MYNIQLIQRYRKDGEPKNGYFLTFVSSEYSFNSEFEIYGYRSKSCYINLENIKKMLDKFKLSSVDELYNLSVNTLYFSEPYQGRSSLIGWD